MCVTLPKAQVSRSQVAAMRIGLAVYPGATGNSGPGPGAQGRYSQLVSNAVDGRGELLARLAGQPLAEPRVVPPLRQHRGGGGRLVGWGERPRVPRGVLQRAATARMSCPRATSASWHAKRRRRAPSRRRAAGPASAAGPRPRAHAGARCPPAAGAALARRRRAATTHTTPAPVTHERRGASGAGVRHLQQEGGEGTDLGVQLLQLAVSVLAGASHPLDLPKRLPSAAARGASLRRAPHQGLQLRQLILRRNLVVQLVQLGPQLGVHPGQLLARLPDLLRDRPLEVVARLWRQLSAPSLPLSTFPRLLHLDGLESIVRPRGRGLPR